jgi:DNA-binding response OmpR family regulator
MNRPNVLMDDPRDFDRETIIWMVDELQARMADCDTTIDQEITNLREVLSVTPAVARLLHALAKHGSRTHHALAGAVAIKAIDELTIDSGGSAPKVIHVHVAMARRALKPHGMTIRSVWGEGYEAPKETRDFLKAIMAGDQPRSKLKNGLPR